MINPTSISSKAARAAPPIRASQALREILTKNPTVKNFTVKSILDSIGDRGAGNSLLFFSIPGMVPVPGGVDLVGISTGSIAGQMIIGRTQIKLPKALLERSVPRKSLAVAIHAILPILERAEKLVKPRWQWATHPIAGRLLGLVIFLLALAIAFPFLGFDMLRAAAIFIISLGLVEKDGLAIMIGVVTALVSLVLVTGVRFSGTVLASKFGAWLKKASLRLGLNWMAAFLKKLGLKWARVLELKWTELLLLWNPETASPQSKNARPISNSAKAKSTSATVRRSQEPGQFSYSSQLKAA